uniref:LRAT domain-containing protein n=1 Tax=Oryzias sinensis TaxID=183150 RepID=A0A8C7XX57_9TELE
MSCYGNLTYPETYLHFWNRKLRLSTSLASNLPWELAEPAFWNTPLLYCTKPGDLIEILRGNFNSWAVYVGNGYVVHFGAPNSSLASRIEGVDGIVKKEKLQYVAGEYSWKVNNTLDGKYRPIPPNEIVKKACSLVGASLKYHLTEFNSEHFATEMRYGKAESRQVGHLQKPLLVITALRRLLYGETSGIHCSGVILAHSSTQTTFKSSRFRGSLL